MKAREVRFNRTKGSAFGEGETVEYTNPYGEMLAYIDYLQDGTAVATVYKPYKQGCKEYSARPKDAAENIVKRHIAREGYELP